VEVTRIPPSLGLALAVRGRREELGLTRAQLALGLGWRPGEARSGWSPRTIVRIEGGERGLRDGGEVAAVARGLELSEEDLRGAARGGGWRGAGVGARGRKGGEAAFALDETDLAALLARLLAEQEEQTALLRRLVAAVTGPEEAAASEHEPARRGRSPGHGRPRQE
jgi:transcriptional regulator with XRE-family HTH domain